MLDLRKQQAGPPVPGSLPGPGSRLPLSQDTILLEEDRQILAKVGWKEGDPLPDLSQLGIASDRESILASQIALIRQQAKAEEANPQLPSHVKGVDMPQIHDLETLSQEKQAEVERTINSMLQQTAGSTLPAPPPPPVASPEAALVDPSVLAFKNLTEQPATPAAAPEAPPAAKQQCQHCGWEVTAPDDLVIEPTDKLVYVQAILGGQRFIKQYPLFGGQIQVTFRMLTVEETQLISKQTDQDARSGRLELVSQYLGRWTEYALAAALQRINGHGVTHTFKPVLEAGIQYDEKPGETVLQAYRDYIQKNVLRVDGLYRATALAFQNFMAITSKMADRAQDPSFWQTGQ